MRTGHLSVRRGKRVKVFLRNGEPLIAKFKQKTDKLVLFFDHEPIPTVNIRTLTIFKEQL